MKDNSATSYRNTIYGILPRNEIIKLETIAVKKGFIHLKNETLYQKKLSIHFIQNLHKTCFNNILPDEAGRFRTIQVTYSSKEAPHFSKIPEMMKILCDDINYALECLPDKNKEQYLERYIEILSLFQHRFVFIHPFVDYNGRTARLLTNFLLMKNELPIIEINVDTEKKRKQYIHALQQADNGDYAYLKKIIEKALNQSIETFIQ